MQYNVEKETQDQQGVRGRGRGGEVLEYQVQECGIYPVGVGEF